MKNHLHITKKGVDYVRVQDFVVSSVTATERDLFGVSRQELANTKTRRSLVSEPPGKYNNEVQYQQTMRLLLTLWSCWWILLACTYGFVVSAAVTSLPNPLKDPETCRSDNTTYRICDPNAILTFAERQAVQEEIELFETYNVTCGQEEVASVQMGVALVRTVSISFGPSRSL